MEEQFVGKVILNREKGRERVKNPHHYSSQNSKNKIKLKNNIQILFGVFALKSLHEVHTIQAAILHICNQPFCGLNSNVRLWAHLH